MSLQTEFLGEIEAFLQRQEMAPSSFGVKAVNDPKFVFDLREGRQPNLGVVERVRAFMATREGEAA